MTARIYSLSFLVLALAIPLRAELTVKTPTVKSNAPVVIITPEAKPRKKRTPTTLIGWATLLRSGITGADGKEGEGESKEETESGLDLSDMANKLFGNKNSGGAKKLGSNGNGTGSNTFFNENAPKNGAKVDPGPKEGNTGGPSKGPKDPPQPPAQAFPVFYPMCLLVHPGVSNNVNETVKGLIDDAADCYVNLVVYPITIKANIPDSEAEINRLAQAYCNINEGLGTIGVKASSVSTCVPFMETAGEMCKVPKPPPQKGWDEGVAGCAQIQAAGGGKIDKQRFGNEMSFFSGSGSAPSIERGGACDKDTVGHEAQGHSQMGLPNGTIAGKGIGDDPPNTPPVGGPEGSGAGGKWTSYGCQKMRENSFPNDGRFKYDRNRQNYFKIQTDPERQVDLYSGRKLFNGPIPPAGPPQPPPQIADRGPGVVSDGIPRATGARNEQKPTSVAKNPPLEAKHPKNGGMLSGKSAPAGKPTNPAQSQANNVLANSEISTPPSIPEPKLEDPTQLPEPVIPPPDMSKFGKGGSSSSVTFNEGAAKNSGAGTAMGSAGSSIAPSSPGGTSSSVTFNEGAAKGGGEKISISNPGSGSSSIGGSTSLGRTGRPPVMVSDREAARTLASEEEKKKKATAKKKKREFGDGLRQGSRVNTNPESLYQSGSNNVDFAD